MLCPHCQNSDPSMFDVEESRPGTLVIILCKVCSKTFVSVAPKGKV